MKTAAFYEKKVLATFLFAIPKIRWPVTILLLNFAPTSDKHLREYGLAAFRKKEYIHKQKKQQCAIPFLS